MIHKLRQLSICLVVMLFVSCMGNVKGERWELIEGAENYDGQYVWVISRGITIFNESVIFHMVGNPNEGYRNLSDHVDGVVKQMQDGRMEFQLETGEVFEAHITGEYLTLPDEEHKSIYKKVDKYEWE